jgi:glycosyltransferase involved in cell wall biosynthesis
MIYDSRESLHIPTDSGRDEGGIRLKKLLERDARKLPLVSIVTVVYNGAAEIRATINSVLVNGNADLEHIIIDGGSTDGTVEILRSYGDRLEYWLSERDEGIYDAMNKAIGIARGKFIYHLNIGDTFFRMPAILGQNIPENVLCVAAIVQTSTHEFHAPSAGIGLRFHNTLHHQGCFYRNQPGLRYALQFKVFSDFDLNQRLLGSTGSIIFCSDVVAAHDEEGISHTTNRFFEVYDIVRKNYGVFWLTICYVYFKYRGIKKRFQNLWQ